MTRRRLAGLLAGALLLAGATGCGIPERSEVRVDGQVTAAKSGSSSFRRDEPPNRLASGTDRAAFVTNFLSAAAGEADRAYYRVKQFVAPEGRSRIQEKQPSEVALTVVRLRETPVITDSTDGTRVTLRVQQIGLLRADGTLMPPVATETEYRFELRAAVQEDKPDTGWYVADPPPNVLLLSDQALRQYYQTHIVYFWNTGRTQLVPDQRYLPLAVPDERRVTEVVKWLTAGPSEWLGPGTSRLPDGTRLINNATGADGRWEVNLDMPVDADDRRVEEFVDQLAWSLPELDGQLELRIHNQTRVTVPDLGQRRRDRPAYPLGGNPQRFCVYDGAVHPLDFGGGEPVDAVPVTEAVNKGVVSAGFSRSHDEVRAALVTAGADKRHRLVVGVGAAPVSIVQRGTRTFAGMGQPVWLRSPAPDRPQGLVVADGTLYRFDSGAQLRAVPLTAEGRVTSVATSLDGHRIAVIVGGALYVAAVNLNGGVVSVGPARRLATSLTDLSAVDWAGENTLHLAGSAGRPAIYDISVDGALETPLRRDVGARVSHLSSYPLNAVAPFPNGNLMYEANGVAYRNSPFDTIKRDEVRDVTPPAAGAQAGNPTAPFFLY
ncbi:LpqB family beta-propeller domain-containing protein [Micromonospora carbonacea]|uniref:Lipoprotein LpqB beta-propeller domain-containing protein n=1 Tax=Micromonospora carbonacea TaxID=47853 RepID=A0A1C5ARV1_9ACTN|nr:LpqB family beta-propeller domain-containing protein [Micromonospora carbonacea]SCF47938.1 Lipoprotein LpqB beta-propeller domain-containing protein [Micromonospora carbonacea]